MIKRLRHLTLLATIAFSALAFAGPESGGGGGVIYLNSKPQLVDFYTIEKSTEFLKQKYNQTHSSQISQKQNFVFNRADMIQEPAFLNVLEIFKTWSSLPYDTIGLWINFAVFDPVNWIFTDDVVSAPPSYRPTLLPQDAEIKIAAYYLVKNRTFHVNINRSVWNQMALQDQVGLLIHETLRHVQLGLSFGFEDEALQKATAMMMLCKPRIIFDQYLYYLLNNRRDLAEQRFEKFEKLTSECWK